MRIWITTVLVLTLSACTQVKPWERGHLADPNMAWQPMPQKSLLDSHIYFSKEASAGGGKASGGGCGCN